MPTILELFKNSSSWQFGTNYKNSVKDDKNIIETIASKTSRIRRQSGVDFNNPLVYGTGTIRIANRTIETTELQKKATGGKSGDGGFIGKGLSKFGEGQITSLSEGRDALKSKLGLPQNLIPSRIIDNEKFQKSLEQDTMKVLGEIKNDGAGSDIGKFLKQTGGGNPKTLGKQAVGQGIGLAKDKLREQAFGAPQTIGQATGKSYPSEYSSENSYTTIVTTEGRNIYDEGGEASPRENPIPFANQSVDKIDLRLVSPVYGIDRVDNKFGKSEYAFQFRNSTNETKPVNNPTSTYTQESNYLGTKTLAERGLPDGPNNLGDNINSLGPNDEYKKKDLEDLDFIPFWVSGLDSSKPVFFRAILSSISETVSPTWNSSGFIGNPYNFYTYGGVERNVTFTLNIYCNNQTELAKNWEKIEYLTSKAYPSINPNFSYVDAPFIKFRLGSMYVNKIAYISSLSYTIEDNSTWEVDTEGFYLPKIISVSATFNFVEQEGSENVLYNYKRSEESIRSLQQKQEEFLQRREGLGVVGTSETKGGINPDGTVQENSIKTGRSNSNVDNTDSSKKTILESDTNF